MSSRKWHSVKKCGEEEKAHTPFGAKGVCSENRETSDTERSHREKVGYSEIKYHHEGHKGHKGKSD
jgi:hypothetical protein